MGVEDVIGDFQTGILLSLEHEHLKIFFTSRKVHTNWEFPLETMPLVLIFIKLQYKTAHKSQKWTEQFEDLLWVCEKNAKLIAVLELFEYVMRW